MVIGLAVYVYRRRPGHTAVGADRRRQIFNVRSTNTPIVDSWNVDRRWGKWILCLG